jgi:hypothetical protein
LRKFLAFDFKGFSFQFPGVFVCHAEFVEAYKQSEIKPVEPGQGNACKGGPDSYREYLFTFLNSISLLFFNGIKFKK